MADAGWIEQFVGNLLLADDDGAVFPPNSYAGDIGCRDGFEGIFHLVESALGREDGDVPIESSVAAHACDDNQRLTFGRLPTYLFN